MNYEKIVTLYDTTEHAEAARRNLEAAGFAPSEISMVTSKSLAASGEKLVEPGIWQRLFGRDIQQHEALVYGRTVEAGGVVLTVRVPDRDVARAMGILNAHHGVDVQRRAIQEGLISGTPVTKQAATQMQTPPAAVAAGVSGEEVLRLAEEQINVGKRLVREGTTRIRRFIIETPVEAQVTLHEEHAQVIRRAISDPDFARNIDWTEKTIEVTETIEEPVITKSSHIAEEVVIRKEGADHVKTVRDKVRRQQVEVERVATDPSMKNEPAIVRNEPSLKK
jgi:stress response protein YsnF